MELSHTLSVVRGEVLSAQDLFPPFHSTHEGIACIKEEYDELWAEIKKSKHGDNLGRVRAEAVHLAAMSIRLLLDCT